MRCQYCHNPDTWKMSSAGHPATEMTADELLDKAERYRSYWGPRGGITVSGGEALMQMDFLVELFTKAKKRGINTCIDTSAQPFTRREPFFTKFQKLMQVTDLILLDIKHIDDEAHKKLTRHSNANILDCARFLSDIRKPVWIRHVLVPEITDIDESLYRLRDFLKTLENVEKIDVLPYHTLGTFKWKNLGIPYELENIAPPTQERLGNARKIFNS